jgi:hypothetical protein
MPIESKLGALGIVLPVPMQLPAGIRMPFSWVRVRGKRAYISGHIALNPDSSIAHPLGKVGTEVSTEEGYQSARLVALAHLASLQRQDRQARRYLSLIGGILGNCARYVARFDGGEGLWDSIDAGIVVDVAIGIAVAFDRACCWSCAAI